MEFTRTGDLKNDILRLFESLVVVHGYDGTTFQMIADTLGITKGAITYHFKNKHHIVGTLIEEFFAAIRNYIDSYPEEYHNQYWRYCTMYIFVYRTILGSKKNENLFFHRNQIVLWESTKVFTVLQNYRTILADFHKTYDEDDLLAKIYMDLGARHRVYIEYKKGNPLFTMDSFCRYHIYLMGILCGLDEITIQENITWAFDFANGHTAPITKTFA